ncbi:TonB-dependent receptor [Porphyromonas gulae]|uniref:TonB-dependent receptor n=1 Tax=Porphyromonas gulae TaxID=111105 RepID=UPI000691DF98|nr:TonB-dependent receptor [Porphyromonas gulae]
MKKKLFAICLSLIGFLPCMQASTVHTEAIEKETDSLYSHILDKVVVLSTGTFIKETNALMKLPGAYSILNTRLLEQSRITSIPALTSYVPNLYIPEYGSKMSSAMYLRGVGARSSGQTIGIYVDGVPYLNRSSFNFELADVQGVQILRGPQGTLYGRNAMAGVINVHTRSPFAPKRTELTGGAGRNGFYNFKAKGNLHISERMALAYAAYADKADGYNRNDFTGKWADGESNIGGRLKLEMHPDETLQMSLGADYDFGDQAAFPYRKYDENTGVLHPVDYNDEGHYRRHILTSRFLLNKKFVPFTISSATGFQLLNDEMNMDQDYTRLDLFAITQRQKNHSLTQEFALRDNSSGRYHWSAGLFGFYDYNSLDVPILFKKDGIRTMLQTQFDKLNAMPQIPVILTADMSSDLTLPGHFDRPTLGAALFHQSTIDDLFVRSLSATIGLRLDYEYQRFDYYESASYPIFVTVKATGQTYPLSVPSVMEGRESKATWELLPKFSLKYAPSADLTTYFSMAKGYKAGGYNEQVFADLIMQQQQSDLMSAVMNQPLKPVVDNVEQTISFKPEYSHSYELGLHWKPQQRRLALDAALFLTDTRDLQLTRFVDNGTGRMIVNAGRSRSIGVETSLQALIMQGLTVTANYGFARAEFVDYTVEKKIGGQVVSFDYKGKRVPFIPLHTYALVLHYDRAFSGSLIDRLFCTVDFNGAGSIYWKEDNTVRQPPYLTLNGRIGIGMGMATLSFWGRNLTDTDYTVFYFESLGNKFKQQAKPLRFGLECTFTL